MSADCVFCRILNGELESSVVARNEHAMAFMDLCPINAGHVLVIPTRHAERLDDLTEDEAANTFRLVHRVARALPRSGLPCESYHVSQANGAPAGQEVFHAHFHVIPRFEGDPLRFVIDPDRPEYDRADLDRFAERISAALGELRT